MRQPRLTFPGAYHHVICRALNGAAVFAATGAKECYLDLLSKQTHLSRIRLFAYCLMDNHAHMVLENTSGRLSDCFKTVNSRFASWYRKETVSRGYVFQDRFKSTLIENDAYLRQAILYVLGNPVRAGIVGDPGQYLGSSAHYLYTGTAPEWLDSGFVEELFGSAAKFKQTWRRSDAATLHEVRTRWGGILGGDGFAERAVARWERRSLPDAIQRKRLDDRYFEPEAKVIREFEERLGYPVEQIDTHCLAGKCLRGELLVRLRDGAGLYYREIAELPPFIGLQLSSLARLYQNAKRRNR